MGEGEVESQAPLNFLAFNGLTHTQKRNVLFQLAPVCIHSEYFVHPPCHILNIIIKVFIIWLQHPGFRTAGCPMNEAASSSLTLLGGWFPRTCRCAQNDKDTSHRNTECGYNLEIVHKPEDVAVVFPGRVTEGQAANTQQCGHSGAEGYYTRAPWFVGVVESLKIGVSLSHPSVARNRGALSLFTLPSMKNV